jgi:DeoR/GlpR family transcriptional regulator of sugar metabolism
MSTDRLERVLQLLETHETVRVSDLARYFDVSEVTVRSDLATLAREGLVARVRGGARALQRGESEVAFDVRLRLQEAQKRGIACAAAALVQDGEAVALDSSTTAYYVALELRNRKELVVVTNGLLIAAALADAPGVSVIVPGGMLRLPAMSLVGDFASGVLRTTQIDRGFFGVRGATLERGLMDLNPEEVRLKRELADACKHVVGVFDSSKWHKTALLSFAPTERVDAIVTDTATPDDVAADWRGRGVEIVTAAPVLRPAGTDVVPGLHRRFVDKPGVLELR